MLWSYLLTAVPLALFIVYLLVMDSFKLTKWPTLGSSIVGGMLMYLLSWLICRIPAIGESKLMISIVEELAKGVILYMLIARHKVGLLGDATIYGSAIGAGFGLMSNCFHLHHLLAEGGLNGWHTVFLGCEAAVMHIGCTSLLAMALMMVHQGKFGETQKTKATGTVIAFLVTIVVHYVHLLWPFNPLVLTALLVAYYFISKRSLFKKNEKFVHDWLDEGISNEIALLGAVQRGEFTTTKAGEYLMTLKENFEPETFFDMYCYVQNYLELSIAARSNLILKEAGMEPVHDRSNRARLEEMRVLRKRIGPTAEIALRPIVDRNQVNAWAITNLI